MGKRLRRLVIIVSSSNGVALIFRLFRVFRVQKILCVSASLRWKHHRLCSSQATPYQSRCNSHFSPILWNGLASSLVRTYSEGRAKEKRSWSEWEINSEKWKYRFRKNFFAIILHTYTTIRAIYWSTKTCSVFKYMLNLH